MTVPLGSASGGAAQGELLRLEGTIGVERLVLVVEEGSTLQGEVDDEVAGRVRSVAAEQLGDPDSAGQIVIAVILAVAIRIVCVHADAFGTAEGALEWK